MASLRPYKFCFFPIHALKSRNVWSNVDSGKWEKLDLWHIIIAALFLLQNGSVGLYDYRSSSIARISRNKLRASPYWSWWRLNISVLACVTWTMKIGHLKTLNVHEHHNIVRRGSQKRQHAFLDIHNDAIYLSWTTFSQSRKKNSQIETLHLSGLEHRWKSTGLKTGIYALR